MSADFTPNQNSYKDVGQFRHWCQKVLPLTYDDSLSYYELLCKVTNTLNESIMNMVLMGEDITKMYSTYIELQCYVNTYFDNLNVQKEIDSKLDKMSNNGVFDNLFLLYLAPFTSRLTELENKVEYLSPTEGTSDMNEVSYARYSDVSGFSHSLSERLSSDFDLVPHTSELNLVNPNDIVYDKYVNAGVETTLTGYNYIAIPCVPGDRFIVDGLDASGLNVTHVAYYYDANNNKLVINSNGSNIQNVMLAVSGYGCAPANANKLVICFKNTSTPRVYKVKELSANSSAVITSLKPLEIYDADGLSSFFVNSSKSNPFGIVTTRPNNSNNEPYRGCGIYPVTENTDYVIQYFGAPINSKFLGYYKEDGTMISTVIDTVLDENGVYYFTTPADCKYVGVNAIVNAKNPLIHKISDKTMFKPFKINGVYVDGTKDVTIPSNRASFNKVWTALGDSVTYRNMWQPHLIDLYGFSAYNNLGIGSTCLADYGTTPMCSDDRINAVINTNADFVTILGGFNDLVKNVPIGTVESIESYDTTTFLGAYSKIINAILTAKPSTHVIILGLYPAHNNGKDLSETRRYSEYNDASKQIADYYGLPFVNLWNIGFNQYTQEGVYSADDIHPNALFGKRIAGACLSVFNEYTLM